MRRERRRVRPLWIALLAGMLLLGIISALTARYLPYMTRGSVEAFVPMESRAGEDILPAEQAAADAAQLVALIESTHPAFTLSAVPAEYGGAKQAFLDATAAPQTVERFQLRAMEYLAILGDSHTGVQTAFREVLDLPYIVVGDALALMDDAGMPTPERIASVGGVPVSEIFAVIDRVLPHENASGLVRNRTRLALTREILRFAGAEDADRLPVAIGDAAGGVRTIERPFVPYDRYAFNAQGQTLSCEVEGDLITLRLTRCDWDDGFREGRAAFAAAIEGGARNVIIDVRGNPGGDSSVCVSLLEAMDMHAPEYGMYQRFSALTKAQRGTVLSKGTARHDPNPGAAKPNPAFDLIVLTDEGTFSSATMLAGYVQDGKLGRVVGRASANAPSSYGDILFFQLTNSRLVGSVSYKRFLRPDGKADPDTLVPDVTTEPGEDAMEAARGMMGM